MKNVEKLENSIYHKVVLMRNKLNTVLSFEKNNNLIKKKVFIINTFKKSVLKKPSKNINSNYINVKSLFLKKPPYVHSAWVHRAPNCFSFVQSARHKNDGHNKFKQLKKISAQKHLALKFGKTLFKKNEFKKLLKKTNSFKALTCVEKDKIKKKSKKLSFINVLSKHFLTFSKKRAHLANFRREKAWENFLFWRPLKNFIQVRTIKQSMFINYYITKLLGKNTHVFLTEPFIKFYNLPHKKFINMHVKRNLVRSKNLYFAKRVQYYQNMHYLINFFVKFTALGVANLFLEHMATQLTRDSRHWLFLKLLKQFFQITFNKESLNFNRMRFVLKGKFRGPARKSKRLIRFKDNREIALQTFTSKVDYSYYPADTKYGTISIKLWIFYKKELIMPSQFVNKYEKI